LLDHAGGRLWPPGPHGRRPPGAGRGIHLGGAARGTLVGSGNPSPPGRLAPAAAGGAADGGGSLVPTGSGRGPLPGGEIAGAAGPHEPESALATAEETAGGARPAGRGLRLVYRGV